VGRRTDPSAKVVGRPGLRRSSIRRVSQVHVDDHAIFAQTVDRYLEPEAVVLDAGAGRGVRYRYDYASRVARVVGVDVDPGIALNVNVDERVIGNLAALPFADATFDLVFSKYVFEHLDRPRRTFRELRRVMKPGGHLVFHTPNQHHYVAWSAMLTPQRFHVWFNGKRGCDSSDIFPTRYRANDRKTIHRLAAESGFQVEDLALIEPKPDYLLFNPVAYRAGLIYERIVNVSDRLADLRCVIVGDLVAV
jgi:SAM-dependent methyltransferase